jgi:hypothetical protein
MQLKIDHLVINVDKEVQEDRAFIGKVREFGLPYEPKWGKGTKGFKVSNMWIGDEYFELVRIKQRDGGGWVQSWTEQYNKGHRGLIGFAIEVSDIEATYERLRELIEITEPEPLRFKWFFNLLNKTMPWKNSYLPQLEGVPFQFFLQQLNDEKSKVYMQQYMYPNSREHGINGISEVKIFGTLTQKDRELIKLLFDNATEQQEVLTVKLDHQRISFIESETYSVEVLLNSGHKDSKLQQLHLGNVLVRIIS